MGMSLAESLQKFTLLSIGDGLVSQIPALIISIGAGLLVTRASDNNNIGQQVAGQIARYPRALKLAAGCMAVFGLMPGMPLLPFMGLAGLAMFAARSFKDTEGDDAATETAPAKPGAKGAAGKPGAPAAAPAAPAAPAVEDVRKLTEVDTFSIEIGYGLLPLAEARNGGDLLARVTGVRKTLAREKGIVVPPVSVRDNLELEANDYRFLLRGKPVARGAIIPGRLLAMNVAGSAIKLRGQPTREPVFNLDATWIDEGERKTAELNNYTVVDPASVLITHLSETLKSNAHLLLGRQDVSALVDHLKGSHAALIAELLPDLVNLGIIQRVLQNLLREGIAILNLPVILEGVADFASLSKNPDDLSELVRRRLGLYFVPELESRPGVLRAVTLDPRFEQALSAKVHRSPTDVGLSLDPATGRHLMEELNRKLAQLTASGAPAVIVVSTENRLPVRRFLEPSFPRLTVLAYQELPSTTEIENAGIIPLPAHLLRQEPAPVKAAA
jgi:flagellar biosynthesis protein FlhA